MLKRIVSCAAFAASGFAMIHCSSGPADPEATDKSASLANTNQELSGCHGTASSSVPASGEYFLTSFGFSASDDGTMSCGSSTRHGSWYYAASRQRYGCGSRIKIEANGKCVVAQTDDYGPDACVERAAGMPIIDASPLVSEHLFGVKSAGYSDRLRIHVTDVSRSTPLGPCEASAPAPAPAPSPAAGCDSATLGKQVDEGVCVQSASDSAWYKCTGGAWVAGDAGCSESYGFCHSATLGADEPPRTCVQSRSDGAWYQCTQNGWVASTSSSGPLGACSSSHAL